jgi:hypothetical protein
MNPLRTFGGSTKTLVFCGSGAESENARQEHGNARVYYTAKGTENARQKHGNARVYLEIGGAENARQESENARSCSRRGCLLRSSERRQDTDGRYGPYFIPVQGPIFGSSWLPRTARRGDGRPNCACVIYL